MAWTENARCANRPSAEFYASRRDPTAIHDAALACCNGDQGCPARRHCLAYAIFNHETAGTWGGMSPNDRNDLARTRCDDCFSMIGRRAVATMVLEARQHVRCPRCAAWVEVVPSWDRPHRNSYLTGTGRRT